MSQARADATLDAVAGWGINHIDTAASYGASEDRLKPWLADAPRRGLPGHEDRRARRATRPAPSWSGRWSGWPSTTSTWSSCTTSSSPRSGRSPTAPAAPSRRSPGPATRGSCGHIGVTGHGLRIAGMHVRSLRAVPVRLRAVPVQPRAARRPRLPRRRRGADRAVRPRAGRPADDQGRGPGPLGAGLRRSAVQLVRAAATTRTPSPGPCATCCPTSACSSTRRATPACCR